MYVCLYVCMYVCTCVCVCMCVCVYVCMYVCMHACMHVCMYVCMHVSMHGWMNGWMDGYMYVYQCIYIYIYLHTHAHKGNQLTRIYRYNFGCKGVQNYSMGVSKNVFQSGKLYFSPLELGVVPYFQTDQFLSPTSTPFAANYPADIHLHCPFCTGDGV